MALALRPRYHLPVTPLPSARHARSLSPREIRLAPRRNCPALHGRVDGAAPGRRSVVIARPHQDEGPARRRAGRGADGSQANKSIDGNPIHIGGKEFTAGVGTRANSVLFVQLNGGAEHFSALVGADDNPIRRPPVPPGNLPRRLHPLRRRSSSAPWATDACSTSASPCRVATRRSRSTSTCAVLELSYCR